MPPRGCWSRSRSMARLELLAERVRAAGAAVRAEVPLLLGIGGTVLRGSIDLLVERDGAPPLVIDYKTDRLGGSTPGRARGALRDPARHLRPRRLRVARRRGSRGRLRLPRSPGRPGRRHAWANGDGSGANPAGGRDRAHRAGRVPAGRSRPAQLGSMSGLSGLGRTCSGPRPSDLRMPASSVAHVQARSLPASLACLVRRPGSRGGPRARRGEALSGPRRRRPARRRSR